MRKQLPYVGEEREIVTFLLIPTTARKSELDARYERRWLEYTVIHQKYLDGDWTDMWFVD